MPIAGRIVFACNVALVLFAILLMTGMFVRFLIYLDALPRPALGAIGLAGRGLNQSFAFADTPDADVPRRGTKAIHPHYVSGPELTRDATAPAPAQDPGDVASRGLFVGLAT
jgi:hypothetical protein